MNVDSISAPDDATTFTKSDATISAAWEARVEAFAKLPRLRPADDNADYTSDEQAQWDIIDAAEKAIHAATATTPREAEMQLWTSLYYLFLDNDQVNATHRRDLDWFAEREDKFDWSERLAFAAIRSLRALQAERDVFAETWLATWTKDGGSVVIDDDGKAQIGWPVYDLSPNYRAPDPAWPEAVRDNAFLHGQAAHDATMKTRFEALKHTHGGVDMLKAHMQAKGLRVAVHTTEQAA